MAAWKARRGPAKVRLNGTFPAKFQHLYTSLTWRFSGWCGARETLSVVSLPPSSFILAMEPAACWMFGYADPSRSGGRGSPVPSARSICAMTAAVDRGLCPGFSADVSAHEGLTIKSHPSKSATDLALVTFAVEIMISFLASEIWQTVAASIQSLSAAGGGLRWAASLAPRSRRRS
jgi:hypothetical protein